VTQAMKNSPLLELARFGQSYWLDDLSRGMIRSGELQRRVAEEGLTGVTVNPSIFHTALTNSADYEPQIRQLRTRPAQSI
jgi:transaldolase